MFFFFTCGTHTFTSNLKGAERIKVQCQNCGNFETAVMKRWEWFTFCFIPVIPFSLKPYKEVGCRVCRFWQDIKYRPDVLQQMGQEQGGPAIMMGGQGPPPPQGVPQGVPQYK